MKKVDIETTIKEHPTAVFTHSNRSGHFIIKGLKHYVTRYGTGQWKVTAQRVLWSPERGIVHGMDFELALTSVSNYVVCDSIEQYAEECERRYDASMARVAEVNHKIEQIAAMRTAMEDALASLDIANIAQRWEQNGHTYKIELDPANVEKLLNVLQLAAGAIAK